jgi:hypothetical protein
MFFPDGANPCCWQRALWTGKAGHSRFTNNSSPNLGNQESLNAKALPIVTEENQKEVEAQSCGACQWTGSEATGMSPF